MVFLLSFPFSPLFSQLFRRQKPDVCKEIALGRCWAAGIPVFRASSWLNLGKVLPSLLQPPCHQPLSLLLSVTFSRACSCRNALSSACKLHPLPFRESLWQIISSAARPCLQNVDCCKRGIPPNGTGWGSALAVSAGFPAWAFLWLFFISYKFCLPQVCLKQTENRAVSKVVLAAFWLLNL